MLKCPQEIHKMTNFGFDFPTKNVKHQKTTLNQIDGSI